MLSPNHTSQNLTHVRVSTTTTKLLTRKVVKLFVKKANAHLLTKEKGKPARNVLTMLEAMLECVLAALSIVIFMEKIKHGSNNVLS